MFAKTQILGVVLATFVAVGFTGCGSSCESGDAKDTISKEIKDSLSKKYPKFAEQIAKIKVSFDKITTTSESKDGKSASCEVSQVHLKYDTGITIFYDNENSRFKYSVRKGDKGINVSTNIGSKIDDMQSDVRNYYTGRGIILNGKHIGGCNGTYQEKDKNGEVAIEGNCVGGLRDGVWKWFDNGFLEQETPYKNGLRNGTEKTYYAKEGIVKQTIDYTDDKRNGALRIYDKGRYITDIYGGSASVGGGMVAFIPYKNGVIDGKMLIQPKQGVFNFALNRNDLVELGFKIDKMPANVGFVYIEVDNGVFVLGRDYGSGLSSYMPEGTSEQEIFSQLEKRKPERREVIVLNNLELTNTNEANHIKFKKNGEEVGTIDNGDLGSLCRQKGKCEEMFKELIDKSSYKNKIYAELSGKEYVEPENATQSENSAPTPQTSEQENQNASEVSATPNEQETNETQNSAETSASKQSSAKEQIKPSFDCSKASTNAEKLVCSDNELASLDNELSKAYANARNSRDNAGKKQLLSEQKAWLATYNQCADKACVKQKLQERIQILQK